MMKHNDQFETSWNEWMNRVVSKKDTKPTWLSDQKSLIEIFKVAKEIGVNPPSLKDANLSNLRTLIKPLRIAVINKDAIEINELFERANTSSNADLRLWVNPNKQQKIGYIAEIDNGKKTYVLRLTQYQFDRITTSSKSFFRFIDQTTSNSERSK